MADSGIIALRYAHAFLSVAQQSGLDAGQAQSQLGDFARTLKASPELHEVLADPSVPSEQKLAVIDALAGRLHWYHEVRNFLAVIMDHGRLGELQLILNEYHKLAEQGIGVAEVEVTSAHELNGDDRQQLEFEVSKLAVSRVKVSYSLDPELLGGAVVRIGSTVYDGSVRAQLDQMKQALMRP